MYSLETKAKPKMSKTLKSEVDTVQKILEELVRKDYVPSI